MAWRSSGATHAALIHNLGANGLINDQRVKEAFLKVDRAHYAPSFPYQDAPQPIGHDATISAPHMHASAVKELLPFVCREKARILDIGSGSGYLTHVLAELAGAEGVVVGVDHIPALRDLAQSNVLKSDGGRALLESGRIRFRVGDGRKGWIEEGLEAGWNAIHVGAGAKEVHDALVRQLRRPGRMFIPVEGEGGRGDQWIWVVDKNERGDVTRKRLYGVMYVPLTDSPGQ